MTVLPTLQQLFNGVISSIAAQLNIVIPPGKSFLNALGGVWAGQLNLEYKYQGNIQKNVWFDLADPAALGGTLERFGRTYIQRDPFAATQGQYVCSVTGTAGATIQANTTFLSDPSSLNPNFLFILDNDYTLTGSGDEITLRATAAGSQSNLAAANTLTCTKPLINVNQTATVATISVNPVDAETIPQYRQAISEHVLLAPQGGAVADYIVWGSPVAGVAKIYPYTSDVATWETDVYVEATLSDSGGAPPDYGYGVPTGTILTNVTNAILTDPITGRARKPMGVILGPANVGAIAVTAYQVAIAFTGTGGMTADQKTLITEALQQAVGNIRPFIAGADSVANQNDTISINLPATGGRLTPPENYVVVVIAMQAAPGAIFTGASMTVNGISRTTYTFDKGIIPYLRSVNVTFS